MSRVLKIITIFVFTYLTVLLLCTNVSLENITFGSVDFLDEINIFLNSFDIIHLIVGIMIYYFYYNTYFDGERFTRKNILIGISSVFLSIIIVVGKNLQIKNVFPDFSILSLAFFCLMTFLGSYLAFYAIIKKLLSIDFSIDFDSKKKVKILKKNNKFKKNVFKVLNWIKIHPIISMAILMVICRLPYLIIYYPGNTTGDTFDQLCQIFNRKASWTIEYVDLVNKNVYLNNHHPVFSTLYLGAFVKVGRIIHSINFGLFLYTLFQTIVSSIVFSFMINYIRKLGVSKIICAFCIVLICLSPVYTSYVITIVKDVPEALFTLIYVMFLLKIVIDYDSVFNKKVSVFFLIATMLFIMLFRNNGIITILFSYPLLFILYTKNYKRLFIILLIPITIYIAFNQVMYRYFDVSKGGKMELFSVPFMQIARVANRKGYNAVENNDKKLINKVLDYKKIGEQYNTEISDMVKFTYRNDATNKDIYNFFKVWLKYSVKYPNVYAASFVNSTYKYFYPCDSLEGNKLLVDARIRKEFSGVNNIKSFKETRETFNVLLSIIYKMPIIAILFKVAFYDWVLIISCGYVIYKKKYKYLIPLMALVSVLLVCLAGPVNGSMRYILPIMFSFPAIMSIDYLVYKESE